MNASIMNSSYFEKSIKPVISIPSQSRTQLNVPKSSILNEFPYIKIQRGQNTEKSTTNMSTSTQNAKSLNSFTFSINSQSELIDPDESKIFLEKTVTEKSLVLEDDNEYEEKIKLAVSLSKPLKNLSLKPTKSSLKKPREIETNNISVINNHSMKQYFTDNYSVPEQSIRHSKHPLTNKNRYGFNDKNFYSQNKSDHYEEIRLPSIKNKNQHLPHTSSSKYQALPQIIQSKNSIRHQKQILIYNNQNNFNNDNEQARKTYVQFLQPLEYHYIQKPTKYLEKYPNESNKKYNINDNFLFNRYFYKP